MQCLTRSQVRYATTSAIPKDIQITSSEPPPYIFGPSLRHKATNKGLYGGTQVLYGHKVSEKNEHKHNRAWLPNVHRKRLWSVALNKFIRVKVVTSVLRTIDKLGGLDEYLIGSDSPGRVKELGVMGWKLRWEVMQTEAYKERAAKEREQLGLPAEGWRAAEKTRKWIERRQALAAAQDYMDIRQAEKRENARKRKATEQGLRTNPMEEENSERVTRSESEGEAVQEQVEQTASAPDTAPPTSEPILEDEGQSTLSSITAAEAGTILERHAQSLNTDIRALTREARGYRFSQWHKQYKEEEERKRSEERQATANLKINEVLEVFERDGTLHPVQLLHKHYLEIQDRETNKAREAAGLKPLTPLGLRKNGRSAPADVPAEAWERLAEVAKKQLSKEEFDAVIAAQAKAKEEIEEAKKAEAARKLEEEEAEAASKLAAKREKREKTVEKAVAAKPTLFQRVKKAVRL